MQTGNFTTKMNSPTLPRKLILASTSRYRRSLLERLGLAFTTMAPDVDETALEGESAASMSRRLAMAKAQAVSVRAEAALVIGSDQVAVLAGRLLGKPGTAAHAEEQLLRCSGRAVDFVTAVAVLCQETGFARTAEVTTAVQFRELTREEIRRYIARDQPLDCAGSFKSEAAGPVLLESMCSADPTAIIGLPLITVAHMLREAGFQLP